ncbi:MAG: CorA family divalent cation transporter, partial [Acidimicrobiia bacterium]
MSKTSTRAYRAGVLVDEEFPVADVSDLLDEPDTIVWVDLVGPSTQELLDLAEELGLHELAVEDAVGQGQRPKVDRYPTHLFLTTYYVDVDLDAARLDETE